jgi:hypothetical protein
MNSSPKPELKEMTGAFIVKFTRRPASEGTNEGVSEGINGGVTEGISQLLEYIRKNPSKRVVEIAPCISDFHQLVAFQQTLKVPYWVKVPLDDWEFSPTWKSCFQGEFRH